LTLYFPGYPDTADAGFTATVPAEALVRGDAEVRTVVVNTRGTRTEIDRRRLTSGAR